ncbi:hypothetical protein ACH55_23890, partial [Salmonella enterica subsp. enterica serovar Typhimurium]
RREGRRLEKRRALFDERRGRLGAAGVQMQPMARRHQMTNHLAAHGAQPDECNGGCRHAAINPRRTRTSRS